jgi:hypothetical protein
MAMSALFCEHFRSLVVPSLMQLCAVQGFLLAVEEVGTFEEAYHVVMEAARRRGALHLPKARLADLEELIAVLLSAEACSHEAKINTHRQTLDRVAMQCDVYRKAFAALGGTNR